MSTNAMISLMKRAPIVLALLLALALASFTVPTAAQDSEVAPEHLALARKYIELTDKSGIYEVALVETAVQTMRTILAQNPELMTPTDAAITKALEVYKGRKGELMDQFARVYALNFTMDELQQIVAFYETPAGTKLATANATINQSIQTVMEVFQVNLRTEFFAQVRANLKEAGYDV
jgi:hypothetical protein